MEGGTDVAVHQMPKRMDSRAEALTSTSEHCMQWMIEGVNGKMVMFVASAVRTSPEHTSHVYEVYQSCALCMCLAAMRS
jgi:hypothetical protein